MAQNNSQDTILRTLGITALSIIVFALIYNILLGGRAGYGFSMNYGWGAGNDISVMLASLLTLAIKILWLVFVISLVAGTVILIKKYVEEKKFDLSYFQNLTERGYNCSACGTNLKTGFRFCPNCKANLKESCQSCGRDLQEGWKCCPSCGKER